MINFWVLLAICAVIVAVGTFGGGWLIKRYWPDFPNFNESGAKKP